MRKLIFFSFVTFLILAITILKFSSEVEALPKRDVADSNNNNENENDDETEIVPESQVDFSREATDAQLMLRANSQLGKEMQPNHLINYVLNPEKNRNRFSTEDHARNQDNEKGLFVVDKKAKHIGVWNGEKGTIFHVHPRTKKVVEEPAKKARESFPNGWRRLGPDSTRKVKQAAFQKKLSDILKT